MIEEKFASGHSFIHQLDPKIRIIASVILSFAAALCDNLYIAGCYCLISIILVTMARLKWRDVMNRLKPLFWFLLMIWIILPLTFDGEIVYQYSWLKITGPGILLCGKITIKSITILLIFTALIVTMTVASLGNGLHKLHVP
ncbi:MAG: cobalt ECF transporter T component CbiQ, partial [Desulfobacula sp.]|nr:cobalt ECF transporter T component CbiQ [Desulfobacula sp.]